MIFEKNQERLGARIRWAGLFVAVLAIASVWDHDARCEEGFQSRMVKQGSRINLELGGGAGNSGEAVLQNKLSVSEIFATSFQPEIHSLALDLDSIERQFRGISLRKNKAIVPKQHQISDARAAQIKRELIGFTVDMRRKLELPYEDISKVVSKNKSAISAR